MEQPFGIETNPTFGQAVSDGEYESIPYLSTKEVAVLIRKKLKTAFPGQKFSVRSSLYAGGSSIHVRWIDGPRTPEVNEIAKPYAGASFNGMIDLKEHMGPLMMANEDGSIDVFRSGVDYVMCDRDYSEAVEEAAKAAILEAAGETEWTWGARYAVAIMEGEDGQPKAFPCNGLEPYQESSSTLFTQFMYGQKF